MKKLLNIDYKKTALRFCRIAFPMQITMLLLAVTSTIFASSSNDYHPDGYQLIFNDEFTSEELDRNRWCTRYMFGGGPPLQIADPECTQGGHGTLDHFNDEQQRYVDINTSGEVMHQITSDGLILRATQSRKNKDIAFESAMIRSKRLFRPDNSTSYYITAQLWLPNVIGTWPAFWLTPSLGESVEGTWPPEIDILEAALNGVEDTNNMLQLGAKQQNWGGTGTHGAPKSIFVADGFKLKHSSYHSPVNLREHWLEMGLEWKAESVCYFLDGKRIFCEAYEWKDNTGNLAPPSPILINLAIGGNWAGRHGIETENFPTEMRVKHVRVYKLTM